MSRAFKEKYMKLKLKMKCEMALLLVGAGSVLFIIVCRITIKIDASRH